MVRRYAIHGLGISEGHPGLLTKAPHKIPARVVEMVGRGPVFGVPLLSEVPLSVAASEVLATVIVMSGEVSFLEAYFQGIY